MVEADNEINDAVKKIDEGRLCNALGVEWRFSPSRSPHQSGTEVVSNEVVLLK